MPTLPQLAAPGEAWSYNNAGFALSGRLIEAVTERGIHDALRELVFAPLGLTRTFTRLTDALTYPVTLGHRDRDGKTEVIRPFQTTSSTTAGGVLTSVNDLMRYARFHLSDGTGADGKPYLPRPRLAQMQTPQVRKHGTDDEMGLGWHVRAARRRDDAGARRHAERPLPAGGAGAGPRPRLRRAHQPRRRVAPGAGRRAGDPEALRRRRSGARATHRPPRCQRGDEPAQHAAGGAARARAVRRHLRASAGGRGGGAARRPTARRGDRRRAARCRDRVLRPRRRLRGERRLHRHAGRVRARRWRRPPLDPRQRPHRPTHANRRATIGRRPALSRPLHAGWPTCSISSLGPRPVSSPAGWCAHCSDRDATSAWPGTSPLAGSAASSAAGSSAASAPAPPTGPWATCWWPRSAPRS